MKIDFRGLSYKGFLGYLLIIEAYPDVSSLYSTPQKMLQVKELKLRELHI